MNYDCTYSSSRLYYNALLFEIKQCMLRSTNESDINDECLLFLKNPINCEGNV